jgi:hypothetical protein
VCAVKVTSLIFHSTSTALEYILLILLVGGSFSYVIFACGSHSIPPT